MGRSVMSQFITITREEDKQILMEHYKLLLESIHKLNDVREITNSFWIALNSALIGMVAYIRDLQSVGGRTKVFSSLYGAYFWIYFNCFLIKLSLANKKEY
jgi:hypothetical protein